MKQVILLVGLLALCAAAGEPRQLWNECQVSHCAECSHYNKCDFCDEGYWLWNGQCIDCIYAIDWCEKCSADGKKCFKCEPGFHIDDRGLCSVCKNTINMCKFCSHYGDVCYECIHPWELKDGKCFYNNWETDSSSH